MTVTNIHVGGQPAEVRGVRGNDSAQGVLPPCPFHLPFPSYCDVAQARRYFASIIATNLTENIDLSLPFHTLLSRGIFTSVPLDF
jgi:hypothetical protein